MPWFAALFLLVSLSSIAVPGLQRLRGRVPDPAWAPGRFSPRLVGARPSLGVILAAALHPVDGAARASTARSRNPKNAHAARPRPRARSSVLVAAGRAGALHGRGQPALHAHHRALGGRAACAQRAQRAGRARRRRAAAAGARAARTDDAGRRPAPGRPRADRGRRPAWSCCWRRPSRPRGSRAPVACRSRWLGLLAALAARRRARAGAAARGRRWAAPYVARRLRAVPPRADPRHRDRGGAALARRTCGRPASTAASTTRCCCSRSWGCWASSPAWSWSRCSWRSRSCRSRSTRWPGCTATAPESQEAALKYFITGAFSSAFFLYGVALLYGVSGSTCARRAIAARACARRPRAAAALAAAGRGPAAGGLRLQGGERALPHVGARRLRGRAHHRDRPHGGGRQGRRLRRACCACSLQALPGAGRPTGSRRWRCWPCVTMVVGNLGALAQSNLKRMLAYSSVAHAGYLLTALVAAPGQRRGGRPLLPGGLRGREPGRLRRPRRAGPRRARAAVARRRGRPGRAPAGCWPRP